MRRHLLVTNDFPPKIGGIQSYLWELWKRLPSDDVGVYTTPYSNSKNFDQEQEFTLLRSPERILLPYPWLSGRIKGIANNFDAELLVWDPAVPLGVLASRIDYPYAVVLHGAEVVVPGRLPVFRDLLARVLGGACLVICAGDYVASEAERLVGHSLPKVNIPPGVDTKRFVPFDSSERSVTRREFGLPEDARIVVSVTRLVPRKGLDVLIKASALLRSHFADLLVVIAGSGRDEKRLQDLAITTGAPVRFLGRISEERLPGLYASSDIFSLPCRSRWFGLEQEGFGIVFLEAAATGIPQIAGNSGGAAEAVIHTETGLVVEDPTDPNEVAESLSLLLNDEGMMEEMGKTARVRAEESFSYDLLSSELEMAIDGVKLV